MLKINPPCGQVGMVFFGTGMVTFKLLDKVKHL